MTARHNEFANWSLNPLTNACACGMIYVEIGNAQRRDRDGNPKRDRSESVERIHRGPS